MTLSRTHLFGLVVAMMLATSTAAANVSPTPTAASLFFCSDCDKTLVYYNSPNAPCLSLPASSGTGRLGYISEETTSLLAEISQCLPSGRLICVSGMRVSTMVQRQSFLPSFKYFIAENGGRILMRDDDDPTLLVEDERFSRALYDESASSTISFDTATTVLKDFAAKLTEQGHIVDCMGYSTMFRVRCKTTADEETIITSLPPPLKHTFNLGYLDVQIAPFSKRTSVAWLLRDLAAKRGPQSKGAPFDFVFFGDDDNDVEIAGAALHTFVSNPCSERMSEWLLSSSSVSMEMGQVHSSLASDVEECTTITRPSRPYTITVPRRDLIDHLGCHANLQRLRDWLRTLPQDQ